MKKSILLSVMLVMFAGISLAAAPRILIASYSWGGNTRFAAQQIQKAVGGTLWEITPKQAYPTDYKKCVAQARKEIKAKFKPELSAYPDFSQYDVIFIGSPNWVGTIAPPVAAFASLPALKGKKQLSFLIYYIGRQYNKANGAKRHHYTWAEAGSVLEINELGFNSKRQLPVPAKRSKNKKAKDKK